MAESVEVKEKQKVSESEEVFGGPVFEPRLYIQRYFYVKQELEKYNVKHVSLLILLNFRHYHVSAFIVGYTKHRPLSGIGLPTDFGMTSFTDCFFMSVKLLEE